MKIHFIGIGGIGVSALTQYYLTREGYKVSGSDLASSEITRLLKEKGAKVFIGKHKPGNLPDDVNLVIYSPAVLVTNPEFKKAKKLGVRVISYPEALGELTRRYFTIAVSGTHGKSTTASMIAQILIKAALEPTVIVGTKLKEFGNTNFYAGKGKFLVIEADEWQASFLKYWPKVIVLTNIEKEHLDYYKNLEDILKTFKEYIGHLSKKGLLIANAEDENIAKILPLTKTYKIEKYSLKQKEAKKIKKILQVPGNHNVSNALAALVVARSLGVPDEVSFKALSEFKGTWRRFEVKKGAIDSKRFTIISDYGHHPTEIEATLAAVREKFPNKKIWCVFQPHQYQRTFYLFDDFVKVFSEALTGKKEILEKAIITDIYSVAGREKAEIKKKVNSNKLVQAINNERAEYLPKEKIKNYLKKNLKNGQILIVMGAGDIYEIAESLSCR